MRDDFLSRDWAASHGAFSAAVSAMVATLKVSLARLNAEHWSAPWKRGPRATVR